MAVQQVVTFLQLLPHAAADAKACTLAAGVCAIARDPAAALEVARLFRMSNGAIDEPLYGSLIYGELMLFVFCPHANSHVHA